MRVLMVMQHANFFRNLDSVVRELDLRGHEVVMLHGSVHAPTAKPDAKAFVGRGLEVAQSEVASVEVGHRPEPPEKWHVLLRRGREVVNRGIYFRPWHPSPERVVEGLEKRLDRRVRNALRFPLVRFVLGRRAFLTAWRALEALSRPSPTVLDVLRRHSPDVVLVSPTIWPKDPVEADYVRAARALGIPTIGYLNSWDNLTSKGTVHVLPDVYMVWNEALAEEAVSLHDVPRRLIRVTGAAHVDRFFELRATVDEREIRGRMGCPLDRSYLVYLCSSRGLIADETELAGRLAEALQARLGPAAPTLVVRPHPTNPDPWASFDRPGTVVYPARGDQADSPESWQEYYNQLSHAICVFGLNTTAFLEAVAADVPCLTIVSPEYFPVQGRTGHFRHLLAANFLEVSADAAAAAERVEHVLRGRDELATERREFARSFLRPAGPSVPATGIVTDTIVALGERGRQIAGQSRARRAPVSVAGKEHP